ncbi:MAG: hypothetical protein PF637_14300 [Spirochaetes bacterium]|nr:hypothetical protein [Spirochaetota bacterium]
MKINKVLFVICFIPILCSLTGCSKKADESVVIAHYGDDTLFVKIQEMENRDGLNEEEYEALALQYMIFASKAEIWDAVLLMKERLEHLHKRFPKNALVLAYYGSVVGLNAIYDENVTNKIKYADDSNALTDTAVAMNDTNPTIRLVRAHTSYEMPDFFDRADIAREDYDFLISCMSDKSCNLPDNQIAVVFHNRAELLRREGEIEKAISYFEKVSDFAPESDIAEKSKIAAEALE